MPIIDDVTRMGKILLMEDMPIRRAVPMVVYMPIIVNVQITGSISIMVNMGWKQ